MLFLVLLAFSIVKVQGQLVPGTISPASQTINSGAVPMPILATDVSGGDPEYAYLFQWQLSTNGTSWSDIPGATSGGDFEPGALTVTTYFRVKYSQVEVQLVAYSNVATVTVNSAGLQSGTIPSSISAIYYNTSPGTLSGTVATGGNGVFSYQWQQSSDNNSWISITGATGQNYTPGNLTATTYFRRSVSSNGLTAQSNTCQVTVVPQLQGGVVSPSTQSVVSGSTASPLTATDASGGYSQSYSYQWQQSANGTNWTNIPGATSRTPYAPGSLTATTYYRLVYSQLIYQIEAYSNVATIIVLPSVQAGTISPSTLTVNYNTSPGQLSGTAATGGNGTFAYQWQQSTDNVNWTNISSATAQNYTPGLLTSTTWFRRTVSSNGVTVQSNAAAITVLPQLLAGTISPSTLTVNYNTSPGQLNGTAATGGNGTFAYQWQQSTDNVNWTNISSATAQNYTPGTLTASTWFRRTVSSNGVTVQSNSAAITVLPQLQPGTISPSTLTVNYNTSPGQLSGTAASGGNGTFAYQWQQSTDNVNWTNISSATAQNYTPGLLISTTWFRRTVTSNGVTVQSNATAITVLAQLQAGTISPSTLTVNYNTSPGQLNGTAATGGNGTFVYQWQQSSDNVNWTNIGSTTAQNYTPGLLTSTTWFRRTVSSNGISVQSNTATVTVLPALNPGTISGPGAPINYNTASSQLTGTAATGGSGTYAYQWQRSTDNATWNNIAGATTLNYTPQPLTSTTWYRRRVMSDIIAYSNVISVSVYSQLDGGTILPGSISIAVNTSPGVLGVNAANGGNGTYTYQWQVSGDNLAWSNVSGATAKDYTPANLAAPQYYRRQVTSNGITVNSLPVIISIKQPLASTPENYSSTTVNFIRSYAITAPEQNVANIGTKSLREVKVSTSYLDGLGRPIQQVLRQGSLVTGGSATDMVATNVYDGMGRESITYLPFAANNTGGNTNISNGLLKRNPVAQLTSFGASQFPGESYLYARTVFETSPVDQVDRSEPAGNSWTGSGRGVTSKHETNTDIDDVKRWNVTNVAGSFGTYAINGAYTSGELDKTIVTDEQGLQQIVFKDKDGKVVLKKQQLTSLPDIGAGRNHSGWLCTYYIYDDLGNLRCTIQPTGVELIQPGWVLTDPTILAEQCFRYEYDNRERLIKKSMPGAGETWMVYDARDRLVLSQDANLRTSIPAKWLCNKYDENNRLTGTSLWTNNQTQDFHAAQAAASVNYPGAVGQEQLTETYYDDYTSLPAAFSSTVNSSDASVMFTGPFNVSPEFAVPWAQSKQTNGLVTWTRARILGTQDYITTVHYYDDQEKVIQTQTQNASGGISILSLQYSFSGQLLRTVNRVIIAGQKATNLPICTRYTYDDLGRVVKTEHGLSFSALKVVSQQEYNTMGQVKTNKLGTAPGGEPLETQSLDYNIRGWLLGVNRPYLQDTLSTSNYFGYDLGYDKDNIAVNNVGTAYANKLFNGNIAGAVWKSTGDDQTRKFDYTYDASGRLLSASFTQLAVTAFNTSAGLDFSLKGMGYDANGNIKNMMQSGWKLGGSRVIDSLSYNYFDKSGRLKNVLDAENDTATRLSDFRSSARYMNNLGGTKSGSATDYNYNAGGNLTADLNKDIEQISYNYLGQPSFVNVRGKGTIEYQYDAKGKKIRKITVDSTASNVVKTTTLYIDECVFISKEFNTPGVTDYVDSLQYYLHPAGKARWKNLAPIYDYLVKDHLGNVRMVLTEEQQTDAYLNASMETALATKEEQIYSNLNTTRVDKPAGYPSDPYTNPNDKVAKVRGDGQKIGPAIILRVMAGDKFNLRVNSWYKLNGTTPGVPLDPLSAIVSALAAGVPGMSAGKVAAGQLAAGVLDPGVLSFLGNRNAGYVIAKPKAYLNYLLFDEQFKPVITNNGKNSGFEQVGADQEFKTHVLTNKEITKNGYLYIYVSNETPNVDVYFDNLQVTHIRGPLLEETHYYPAGLVMEGISSKAFANPGSKQKFNNGNELQDEEFGDGSGLEWYDAQFRMYDPQIGRFHQVDPLGDITNSLSPFVFANGNSIIANDPMGLISTKDNPDVLPTYTITHRRTYLRGFNWPRYTKKEVDIYRNMKYQYDLRRQSGKAEIAQGDSKYYRDNVVNYRRRYDAKEDGRKMQLGAVAAIFSPLAAHAIISSAPAVVTEWGLLRTGGQIFANKYGASLIGATALNIAQNGGDVRKIDGFDITTGALNPYKSVVSLIGLAAINSAVDYNAFSMSNQRLNYLGNGKNIFQVGFDFSFSLFGEGAKFTYGTLGGTKGAVGMFTDITTGNLGGQVQQLAGDDK
jgi:RHS repeat-associated protein